MSRLLLCKVGGLGDTLSILPTAEALLAAGEEVTLLCAAPVAPLAAALLPGLRPWAVGRAVWRGASGVLRALGRRPLPGGFDAALLSPDEASAVHVLAARMAPRRLGFAAGVARAEVLTPTRLPVDPARPMADLSLDLARVWLGRPDLPPLAARSRRAPAGTYGLVHPGAASTLQRWPRAAFAAVAAWLEAATGFSWPLVETELPPADLLARVAGARGLVGCHSGPVQLAAWLGVPWVAVAGPTARAWDPPVGNLVAGGGRVLRARLACQPCGRLLAPARTCAHRLACLAALSPDAVAAAMLEAMAPCGC